MSTEIRVQWVSLFRYTRLPERRLPSRSQADKLGYDGTLLPYPNFWLAVLVSLGALAGGCGSTKSRLATEQFVMSDAVDRAVSDIDFRPLSGHKVFLDTKYASGSPGSPTKTFSIVNTDYIISSVRQQLMAADCRLTDTAEGAELDRRAANRNVRHGRQ